MLDREADGLGADVRPLGSGVDDVLGRLLNVERLLLGSIEGDLLGVLLRPAGLEEDLVGQRLDGHLDVGGVLLDLRLAVLELTALLLGLLRHVVFLSVEAHEPIGLGSLLECESPVVP